MIEVVNLVNLIDVIRSLIALLETDALTVAEVVGRVGAVKEDPGVPQSMVLRPRLAGVRGATLARHPETLAPYTVDLRIAPRAQPTVAALKAAFGDYRSTRTDMGRPREIVFGPLPSRSGWRVAVIAELKGPPADLDGNKVTAISLRRDRQAR